MTKLEAMRALVSKPREVVDDGKIGHRVIYAEADGREKLNLVFRVLNLTKRRAS